MHLKAMNRGSVTDTEMGEIINTITDGLFSVFVSLGKIFIQILWPLRHLKIKKIILNIK